MSTTCRSCFTPGRSSAARLSKQADKPERTDVLSSSTTGPVEEQINRLKLIKRSMYGRGSFELLRQRVLIGA
jgi:transposase